MSKLVKLNHNKFSTVDNEDFDYINSFNWRLNTNGYATRTRKNISMARIILNAKKGEYVDHINRNKLDNRKCNLRIVTNQENNWNKDFKLGKLDCKGVRLVNNKYQAYYTNMGKQINIGRFNTKIEAMKAYDIEIIKQRGSFAITNKSLYLY